MLGAHQEIVAEGLLDYAGNIMRKIDSIVIAEYLSDEYVKQYGDPDNERIVIFTHIEPDRTYRWPGISPRGGKVKTFALVHKDHSVQLVIHLRGKRSKLVKFAMQNIAWDLARISGLEFKHYRWMKEL